jgi:tetratricopeptide (TPR) repeat protein
MVAFARRVPGMGVVLAVALAVGVGCGPARSGSLGAGPSTAAGASSRGSPSKSGSGASSSGPAATAESGSATTKPSPAAAAAIARAKACLGEKKWVEAAAAADAAIEEGADTAEVYLLKAQAHRGLDQYEAAEGALLEANRRNRKSPEPLFMLAEMAERMGLRGRCEELYRRILDEVDAGFIPAREQLIRLYLNNNQIDAATELFAGFARLGQSGAAVDRCQAYLNFKNSRSETRLKDYQAALEEIIARYPSDPRTRIDLAMLLFASQDYQPVLEEADRALAIAPEDFRARELKVMAEARLLKFDAAEQTLRGLLVDRPHNGPYQRQLIELA